MTSSAGAAFSFLVGLLFAALLFLQIRFPRASKAAETTVLTAAAAVFFSICYLFLH
jgi:hypothetical protein